MLMDRGLGLLGLLTVAAVGSSVASRIGGRPPVVASMLWLALAGGLAASAAAVLLPGGVARLLSPLRLIHQEWVGERIGRLTGALTKFRNAPGALAACLAGRDRRPGRARRVLRRDRPQHEHSRVGVAPRRDRPDLVRGADGAGVLNGFGVREATFTYYFSRIGLPIESALVVSFMGAGLIILFSLSGAVAYLLRGPKRAETAGLDGTVSAPDD